MVNSKYSFLYEHRGMLQTDRRALAPSPDAMRVLGWQFEDLVRCTAEFAKSVRFYGDDNISNDDWAVFFTGIYDYDSGRVRSEVIEDMVGSSSVNPHLALLFAFYKMLLVAQEDINNLTGRQLEFYFRDVLGFEMEKGVEGPVTVFAELAKNNAFVSIPKGLLFDAGKDVNGEVISYQNVEELRLGREEVAFFAKYDNASGFEAIGGNASGKRHSLCIASKLFCLSGRKLRVIIGNKKDIQKQLRSLKAEYTSIEGWVSAGEYDLANGITIQDDMPPLAPYNPSIHGDGMDTDYPVIRLVSENGFASFLRISPSLLSSVQVVLEDGEPLRVENKYGPFENRSGVNPFGYECKKGDWFRVVLPLPADDLPVIFVEMNNEDIYEPVESEGGQGSLLYRIVSDECDQEFKSKGFSMKLLQIMKKDNVGDDEIENALDGSLMAVLPRLKSPITIHSASFSDSSAKVFLSHPCGAQDITGFKDIDANLRLASPQKETPMGYTPPSALYLAFSGADLDRGQISLYFHVTDHVKDPGWLNWYRLIDGKWERFIEPRILRDTTYGLSQDGTVVLDYQEKLQAGGGGFTGEYSWIKCVCDNSNCLEVTEVRSRAIELSYSLSSKGFGPSGAALPAGTITKTMVSVPGLKKIVQYYDGQVGKKAEDPAMFRRRVAEQLRHKGRAWSAWDYENLVLEAFPEVAYAKCLPSSDGTGNPVPGAVTMVVIPSICENDLEPSASVRLINKVREVLKRVCSPFADIRIVNPSCRKVKVTATIALHKGYNDPVRYEALVSDALLGYLRSWKGYEDRMHFREGMGVSDIIAFLEALPYIDVIESIDVRLDDKSVDMEGSIELNSPLDVITSAPEHDIRCHTAN